MTEYSRVAEEVRKWVLAGCRWRNHPLYSDPVEAFTRGDKLLSHQLVFLEVLDCVFARGKYSHLRPIGRHKMSHSDASFSRNIYSPVSPDNIPLEIAKKYAMSPEGVEQARNEWEYEKLSRGSVISSPGEGNTVKNNEPMKKDLESHVDLNLMTRECAFSFIQLWLSQVIHDSDIHSERLALNVFHQVVKLSRNYREMETYIQSIRNLIVIPPSSAANSESVMKNIFVLLITRDIVQDLRYNWGCHDLHRLRLPIRYGIADGHIWGNVFSPTIIGSIPSLSFSRGSLAGIVALAEVLAYHVIEPSNHLATTLCTELVKRINTHSLGYETALRATRAALTRWAFEQNRSTPEEETGAKYDHGLDEPKEIVLPLLVKMRSSLLNNNEETPGRSLSTRKRCRSPSFEGETTMPQKKSCQVSDGEHNSQEESLFTQHSLDLAKRDAKEVTSTPGALEKSDKVDILNECIDIIEKVLVKRRQDFVKEEKNPQEDSSDYVDMISEILVDLQCLDLGGTLSDRDIVAAAMEKTCSRMLSLDLVEK